MDTVIRVVAATSMAGVKETGRSDGSPVAPAQGTHRSTFISISIRTTKCMDQTGLEHYTLANVGPQLLVSAIGTHDWAAVPPNACTSRRVSSSSYMLLISTTF